MKPRFSGAGVVKFLLRVILRPLFRVRVSGDPSVLKNERTLIVANHESFLDGLLLGAFLPIDAVFVVHAQVLTKWYFRLILRYVPHLAVDSASPLSMKLICRLVETGKPVVIFPEGRLTITGSLMKVYDGAAFVAAKTGATVVPVRIEGSGRSYFGRLAGIYPLKLFPKIRIAIQARRQIPMPALPSAKLRRRRAGELMRRILLDMLGCHTAATDTVRGFSRRESHLRKSLSPRRRRPYEGGVIRIAAAHGVRSGTPHELVYSPWRGRWRGDA